MHFPEINLTENEIEDQSAIAIAKKKLCLASNKIHPEGGAAIGAIPYGKTSKN